MGVAGTLLVAMQMIEILNGKLPDMWFIYIPAGLYLMVQELGASFGYFDMRYPTLIISRRAVEVKGILRPRLIILDKIRTLELSRGKIRATYRISGSSEKIRIPYSLRGKENYETLKKSLESRCREADVEFNVT